MNPKVVIFSVCLALAALTACNGRAVSEPPTHGKYQVSKSYNDDGSYNPAKRNEGRYIHMVQPYVHVHDSRELGQYQHIHIPYDGGYGPYAGLLNPYLHDETGYYDGSKYTTTTTPRPTTRRTTTTTTTTVKPRLFNYYDEGGWRILRQEEEKKKHKYDFLYLTENGIYGEERAHLSKEAGTAASGYYEYTGDDGELYRVNYKSDHRGFIPEGDHIPTPPPIPDAIQRSLEYNAKKKEIHGSHQTGQYEHKSDPIRRQNMPTIDRPLSGAQPVPYQVKPFAPVRTATPQPRFLQYNAGNQYSSLPTGLGSTNAQTEQPQQEVYESQTVAPYESPVQQNEQPQSDQPQPDQSQSDKPQPDQPQSDQPQSDKPQSDQPQSDKPQPDQPQSDKPQPDQPQSDQAADQYDTQETQASEQINVFQPPYQVPEHLSDKDDFEYATA